METYEEAGKPNALLNGHLTAADTEPGLRHRDHVLTGTQTHAAKMISLPAKKLMQMTE